MSDKMREALKLADAALSGANMNMNVVRRKISEALAEQPAQGEAVVRVDSVALGGRVVGTLRKGANAAEVVGALLYTAPPAPAVPTADERKTAIDLARRAGTIVYLGAPAPAVPDGWKLVPVEPTDDMEGAACHELRERGCPAKLSDIQVAWSVMLAAAPELKP